MDEIKALLEAQRAAVRRVCALLQEAAAGHSGVARWRFELLERDGWQPHRDTAAAYQQLAASEYRAIREAMGVE